MVAVVVGELYQWQVFLPPFPKINHTRPQHVFKCLDGTLALTIRLRDVRSNVTYVPPPLQVLVSCHRVGPRCVRLRSKNRLPFALGVALSRVKLQLERSLVSTLPTERLVSGKEGWTGS
ncbi:hypothetical protein Hanom_Chr05g00421561 [Helianthus anomalus]